MIRTLTVGLVVTLVATAAWAQTTPPGDEGAQRWYRVSWAPPADGAGTIKGSIFNDSQYRVTDVRMQIEGMDADHHLVGRRLTWDLVSLDRAPQAP
jgi:hypothetical protein